MPDNKPLDPATLLKNCTDLLKAHPRSPVELPLPGSDLRAVAITEEHYLGLVQDRAAFNRQRFGEETLPDIDDLSAAIGRPAEDSPSERD